MGILLPGWADTFENSVGGACKKIHFLLKGGR